jgi:hypothetical protein
MTNGFIQCVYCKKKVTRNCYGKHLLSRLHREQVVKENKEDFCRLILSKSPLTILPNCLIKETPCSLCLCCKKYYIDSDSTSENQRLDAFNHFQKSPDCKANYIQAVKDTLNPKQQKPVKEMLFWKKKAKELQEEIDGGEDERALLEKRSELLEELIGSALNDDELESRFEFIRKNFSLPLYKI